MVLGDEVLTPDSSRFWPADDYEPGRAQASFDKQYVRDWLDESGWDHSPPGPELPDDVVAQHARQVRRGVRADQRAQPLTRRRPSLSRMNLFVCGLRRSGTTIVYDALAEDPELRCFYEPLREDCRDDRRRQRRPSTSDLSAETRELREALPARPLSRSSRSSSSTGAGRGRPRSSSSRASPTTCASCSRTCSSSAPDVAIKETRLHHKLGAVAELDPDAAVVHLVRDPRAVTASMLLGRRRRTDIYPDAETFFTARTGRRLWSSRRISEELIAPARASLDLPADIPDFLRPLLVWKVGVRDDGRRRPAAVRRPLRAASASRTCAPTRRRSSSGSTRLIGRTPPDARDRVGAANIRSGARDPPRATTRAGRARRACSRWSPSSRRPATARSSSSSRRRASRSTSTPPAARSRLSGFMGRARRRLG